MNIEKAAKAMHMAGPEPCSWDAGGDYFRDKYRKMARAAAPFLQEEPSVILSDGEDGWTIAEFPSMPGCISQGKGESEALRNLADAIEAVRKVKQKRQPQPVDGELVDAMYAIISEMVDVRKAAQDCVRVAADRLLADATGAEVTAAMEDFRVGSMSGTLNYFMDRRRARLTAKKTPEERVKVEFISASDDFGHTVFMDAEESGYFKTRGNAEIYRLGLIAKLRESEGK